MRPRSMPAVYGLVRSTGRQRLLEQMLRPFARFLLLSISTVFFTALRRCFLDFYLVLVDADSDLYSFASQV